MNKKLILSTILLLLSLKFSLAFSTNNSFHFLSDSTDCILFYELTQDENGDFVVSLLPDTSWSFPFNIVSTAQITVKVPTGGFEVGEITDLIDGVSFFNTGRDNSPEEAPNYDYISFSLGSQGTSRIPFRKGEKIGLFSFTNTGSCPDGNISLMDNLTDPFFPPNSKQSNAGLQITVSGFGGPDLPVGIIGPNISCNPMTDTPPVDTMIVITPVDTMVVITPVDTMVVITPVDTMVVTTPVDTMVVTTPVDTMVVTTPVDTMVTTSTASSSIISYELELDADGNYIVSLISDTTWNFPFNIVGTAQITIKVPTGGFLDGDVTDIIPGLSFIRTSRDNSPIENRDFDYLSFSLRSQGTSRIPFQKGQKVNLFSFKNIGTCPNGTLSLMDNSTDPFLAPNSKQSNPGQQMNVSGNGSANLPIGILGSSLVACQVSSVPTDTTDVSPIDTTSTPPLPDSGLTIQMATQNISCTGSNDGIIVLKPTDGQAPYSYQWSNGATTSSIENLSPGTYIVTVTDATGFALQQTVLITESDVLSVAISKANVSQAGANDGSGRAIVTGGAAPYTYSWSNGSIQPQINNLSEGSYNLTVTDAFGCTTEKGIILIDQSQCPTIDVALNLQTPSCSGENNGQIMVTPQGGQAPFDFVWEIGTATNTIANIPSGVYMVTVTDGTGCTMAVSAMLQDPTPMSGQLVVNAAATTISSIVTGGVQPYTYNWSNGETGASISNLIAGTYTLTLTDNLGCARVLSEEIAFTEVIPNKCTLNKLTELGSSLTLDSVSCNEKGVLCLPISIDSMIHYNLFLDGQDASSILKGCQFETFFAYSYAFFPGRNTTGNYEIREWMINGVMQSGTFTSIDDLVNTMNNWDPAGNWVNLPEFAIIQGGAPDNTYGSIQLLSNGISTLLEANNNLTPRGTEITFKPGSHTLVLTSKISLCSDSLSINLPCNGAGDNIGTSRDSLINITIQEGGQINFCLEPLFGTGITISTNNCPELSGTATSVFLNERTNCVDIAGLMIGTEEICYTITDDNGSTIDLSIVVNVQAPASCLTLDTDTIYSFAPECAGCLPIPFSALSNATLTIDNEPYIGTIRACSSGGTAIVFDKVGAQNLRFSYGANCVLEVVAVVGCDEDLVIEETIDIGTMDVICPILNNFEGPFVSVENLCPDASGMHVVFDIFDNDGCISFNGVSIGSDTACIKFCNAVGFCDTVTLIYHVEDQSVTPTIFEAVDDSTTIQLNETVVIDVLGNDSFRFLDTFYLVSEPISGNTIINADGTFTYIAQTGFCDDEVPVTFEYAICESSICDTATVSIYIDCFVSNNLVVYNGFSPNGDGINDSFRIDGIENYPGNTVRIFNRWGNRVFGQDGYKNEWSGSWNGRTVLPDGTYFYIIDLGDGSDLLKGYLHIRR